MKFMYIVDERKIEPVKYLLGSKENILITQGSCAKYEIL